MEPAGSSEMLMNIGLKGRDIPEDSHFPARDLVSKLLNYFRQRRRSLYIFLSTRKSDFWYFDFSFHDKTDVLEIHE
jgi:hypothetical protein